MVHMPPWLVIAALALLGTCFGVPLTNNADCDEETGATSGAGTIASTVVTTVTTTISASASSTPSDTSKSGLCQGQLERHGSLVLWEGMPNRTDTAGYTVTNWPWMEEVATVTNALLGLVRVEKESGTNAEIDTLADEYIPNVIFGASEDTYTRDPHAYNDPEAVKSGKYRPRIRVNSEAKGKGAVSLNLFPLSEKGALRVCVTFDLAKKEGDKDGPVWWKAIHAAFDLEEVKARLKDNAWYPEKFVSKNQFTTMAMLEMLTGLKTEYAFRQWNGSVQASGKGKADDYEQEWNAPGKEDQFSAYQDWILGTGHNKPTANWNPTVIFSQSKGLRAVKPFPKDDSFKSVYLQDSRSTKWPYWQYQGPEGDKKLDILREYKQLWSGDDIVLVWVARLKIAPSDMAPLSAAPKRIGDEISKSRYFMDDSIIGSA